MALELEKIINKHESVLKKYRGLYVFADLLATFLVLYTLFVLFNMRDIFLMFPAFEPYTGSKYSILGSEIIFETLGLIVLSFALSLILTAVRYYRAEKKDAITLIEEKYPVLRERMRTAYDNRDMDNIIVRDLIGSVVIDSKPVQSSAFLNRKKLAKDVLLTVFAVAVLVYVAHTGYQTTLSPTDMDEVIDKILFPGSSDLVSLEENGGTSGEQQSNKDLFGEPAVIIIEGTEVDLEIPPGAGEGFMNQEEGEERDNASFIQSDLYNPEAIASQSYYENLPEGYRSVIQTYFEQLAEE
ncbi:hypothetical protein MSSIT_2626 [Methanosarcina siciliae T4/M]|uniref:Uncharacterized protein n=2 Tax=Methanosarcina siciliae TaxID=38027 RepID=A0A0E3PF65_9EURY|nr:hypothetical protein [Methanosarcina siciliae]AKB29345.1 hypothetical protein MSSIT_2626 [Methanosarcina siciliae T4/M]AKB33277.1 hypothetical protein MSSIH_2587 [Methanosarcina siciliae HI350]